MHFIDNELELLRERKEHPELFKNEDNELSALPKLYWNEKFKKRDLFEILTALHAAKAIVDHSGNVISFQILIDVFSQLFNIQLPKAYEERKRLLGRASKLSSFLDLLIRHLKENSKK